jgi:uncharacterized secreted protein with C-terminal beta-propeller domain
MKGISALLGIFVLILIAGGFLFVAMNNPALVNTSGIDQLKKFSSEAELKAFLKENYEDSVYGGMYSTMAAGVGADRSEALGAPAAAPSAQEDSGTKEAAAAFSTTNIQVEGVDEADIIKTDGRYIYALAQGKVYIADAYPAEEAQILSEIKIDGYPSEMYINGDRLVVFTSGYGGYYPVMREGTSVEKIFAPEYDYGPVSRVLVYDVSDPSNPALKNNISVDGSYYDSRMIGDYVYVVSQKSVYNMDSPGIPRISVGTAASKVAGSGEVYYFDVPGYSYQFTSILSFNVNNDAEEPRSKVFLMSYGQNLYVSMDNIYITYRKQISQKKIAEDMMSEVIIPNLPPDLSIKVVAIWNSGKDYNERMQEISELLMEYIDSLGPEESARFMGSMQEKIAEYYAKIAKELERSSVHRISVSNGNIEYASGGSVPGNVLDQFSMDEKDGYFRIATTTSGWIGGMRGNTLNHMYVLDSGMNIVGSLENLAEGESIYSVRFMGDKAYMVTFRRTDPLFVIDLSDPTSPSVLGELKIPGYSEYLHPYDESHIIGFGMDADESGRTKGLKLSLFDVTDFANPKEMDNYLIGGTGSYSYALHDHKAFLFDRDKELLVIPATVSDWTEGKEWRDVNYSDGAQIFRINLEEGFVFRGEIVHVEEKAEGEKEDYYPVYDNSVKRSLYIGDVLYTLSDAKIKLNALSDLAEIKQLVFGA